ncbi:MAG: hypothetical protein JWM89_2322 [Acidimicrobiales bacterium]|nr:hypothetical protein [Acidimicrobiales bacterium]
MRLDDDDEHLLDELAAVYGGRSGAIRTALRSLSAEHDRQRALAEFLAGWEAEAGPVDEVQVAAMAKRLGR